MRIQSIKYLILFIFLLPVSISFAQEEPDFTGLPGDHFSLYGAMEMFKKAKSIEEFEKSLNDNDNAVNNLDLNEDGEVDYISVIDNQDGNAHAFVLQVALSKDDHQDIAVIELEKTGKESADLQIVGDEDIFGENIIVEASDDSEVDDPSPNKRGPSANIKHDSRFIIVNVWTWPVVRFVYAPAYRPWVSPWSWRHYPTWYRPWKPLAWNIYHPMRLRHHHIGFRTVHTHRVVVAHRVYTPHRVSSVTVKTKHSRSLENYRVNRTTRTTTVTGPRGKDHTVKRTKTTVQPRDNANKGKNNGSRKKKGN
jgi:hypothetical protein